MKTTVIKNVKIYKGDGNKPYMGDICFCDGKIVEDIAVGNVDVIDGTGLSAAPGFIDVHTHSDMLLGYEFNSLSRVSQGITSQIAGQCGKSGVLRNQEMYRELDGDLKPLPNPGYDDPALFADFKSYRKYVDHLPMVENTAFLVGHGNIRRLVMGFDNRKATPEELQKMRDILREALENGAVGLSSGLFYPPGEYAASYEMEELCKIVAEYDSIYVTHIRSESDAIMESIEEAIHAVKNSGCRLNISHLKVAGVSNHGKAKELLARLRKGKEEGVRITADQYPYSAGCTSMESVIPPVFFSEGSETVIKKLKDPAFRMQVKEEIIRPTADFENTWIGCGGFDKILIGDCMRTREHIGKTVADVAAEWNMDEFETFFDLMVENEGEILGVYFDMNEDDVRAIICAPGIMVGCDTGAPVAGSSGHPRTFGTCTRLLGYYSRELDLLPMEMAVHKMTGLAADTYRMVTKGYIEPGRDADIVLFDENKVIDKADFVNPELLSQGIEMVFINGEVVYRDGAMTDARPGRGLYANKAGEVC